MFSVNDDGGQLRQLTPFVAGSYYMPSWVAFLNNSSGTGWWLTKNFSPDGRSILYFQNPSSDPADGPYSGKYYVKNLVTGAIQPLFAGSNDNAAPGYGYLARDPANGNTIAFANSTSEYKVASPCVYLMNADGSNQRQLWCAPPTISVPNAETPPPSLAVESMRWSGNGQKLMVYVSYLPPPLGFAVKHDSQSPYHMHPSLQELVQHQKASRLAASAIPAAGGPVEGGTGSSALFVVDVASKTAQLVHSNVFDPPSGDISYDGSKVIYQPYDFERCDDEDTEALGQSLCFKDLTTGTVTDLFQPIVWNNFGGGWWNSFWYREILLSPDGSKAVFTMQSTTGTQEGLYTIHTDGTHFRPLTSDLNPSTTQAAWTPVAWSRDGTRILANLGTVPASGNDKTLPSEVHIITVRNGRNKFVTKGYAVDWVQEP